MPSSQSTENRHRLVRRVLVAALLLAIAGGGAYWYMWERDNGREGEVWTSGNIEATTTEISFEIAGRMIERLVDEGQRVEKGQVVARLDDAVLRHEVAVRQAEQAQAAAALAELEAGSRPEELAAAEAALRKARFGLAALEAGSRHQEISAAQAAVNGAAAERDRLKAEYGRARQLREKNAITQEQFDRAKAAFEVALEQFNEAAEQYDLVREGTREQLIDQARAALDEARAHEELVRKGPREETIAQARARLEQAQAAVRLAQERLDDAVIRAPLSGVVTSKNTEPGEYVAPGTPVVTVADLDHVWLRAYIDETDLGRVTLGQRAEVFTDTFPGKVYPGRVSFVSPEAEFTPKSVQTERERVRLVFRIKIDLTSPRGELLPGMPADARILLEPPAAKPRPLQGISANPRN